MNYSEAILHEQETKSVVNPLSSISEAGSYWLAKILHSNETVLCKPTDLPGLSIGTMVVLHTKYCNDMAQLKGEIKADNSYRWEDIVDISRIATDADLKVFKENGYKEKEAFDLCRLKIEQHQLDMKLVSVHCVFDEPKIVFFFTSDSRVDFRVLVKDLVAVFHIRIELRQIGVRDETRLVGGQAVCGRALCCNSVSDKLLAVSIKMAKVQSLNLNSTKISGPCGRLLCCLAYEYDAYRSELKELPQEGLQFTIEDESYTVQEVNVLSRTVYLRGQRGGYVRVPSRFFVRENSKWRFTEKTLLDAEMQSPRQAQPI